MNPEYPVYIISKNRYKCRLTSRCLERIKVPYHIVIEPQEYKKYKKVINSKKILILPFSNLGQGSIPARNWVWEYSLSTGVNKRHWILDDNIRNFYRLNRNTKIIVESGTIFKAAEDFVDRYKNIAIAGFHYDYFKPARQKLPPYYLNTRIYSCILIKNNIPYRWRGTYNEDTDLSIRVLKDGWCTVLFNAFLAQKVPTMQMKGGNREELYDIKDGRLKMSESLKNQHPGITRVVWKYNRWSHYVNYKPFRYNKLIKKKGLIIPKGINNYKMKLITIKEKKENE